MWHRPDSRRNSGSSTDTRNHTWKTVYENVIFYTVFRTLNNWCKIRPIFTPFVFPLTLLYATGYESSTYTRNAMPPHPQLYTKNGDHF